MSTSGPLAADTADSAGVDVGAGAEARAWWLVLGVLFVAAAGVVVAFVDHAVGGIPAHSERPQVVVAVGFAATAVLLLHDPAQRGNALLFGALTVVWIVSRATVAPVGWAAAPCYLVASQLEVLAVTGLLRYPAPRLEPLERRFVVVTGAGLLLLSVAVVVTSTPDELALTTHAWPTVWDSPAVSRGLLIARSAWTGVGAALFLALLVRRLRRLGGLERRTLAPVLAVAALVGAATLPILVRPWLSPGVLDLVYQVRSYLVAMVALAFVASALQLRLARGSVVELVERLSGTTSVGLVQDALRHTLGDPHLEVWYWLPEEQAYVDGQGVPRDPDLVEDRLVLPTTTADGRRLAVVVVDTSLRRHHDLLEASVAVSRFALENARLEAGLRAQLLSVRQARARLLTSGLEERRRLERDLHDGAQQRILAVGLRLGALQASGDEADLHRGIAEVREELHTALEELRDLARGIYPAVLTQGGLAPALEAVVERLPLAARTSVPRQRFDPDVESAAYLVACEALTNAVRHAGARSVSLEVDHVDGELRVRVSDDGTGTPDLNAPDALRGLRDRVVSLGGELRVDSRVDSGTRIEALFPCA